MRDALQSKIAADIEEALEELVELKVVGREAIMVES